MYNKKHRNTKKVSINYFFAKNTSKSVADGYKLTRQFQMHGASFAWHSYAMHPLSGMPCLLQAKITVLKECVRIFSCGI
jgi:hypothetical protein